MPVVPTTGPGGRDLFLVVLVAAAILLPFSGSRELFDTDEGRFGAVAWTMARSGDWVTPYVDDLPFLDKPPLVYWIQAAVMQATGPTEIAARAPNLLAGIVWVLLVYLFARDWTGRRRAAWLAALLAATSAAGILGSRFGPHLDMPLATCIAGALYAAWRGLHRPSLAASLGLGLAVGSGLLAKGPLAVAVPLVIAVAWGLSGVAWRQLLRVAFSPVAWGTALLIAGPWYALVEQAHPGTFVHFVGHEHLSRFAEGDHRQFHPWWYYVPVVLIYLLPWTPLAWSGRSSPGWRRALDLFSCSPWWPRTWHAAIFGTSALGAGDRPVPTARLAWATFLAVFVLFTISRQKLFPYLLTGAFPLFVLVGAHLERLVGVGRRFAFVLPALLGAATVGGGLLVWRGVVRPGARVPLDAAIDLPRWLPLAPWVVGAGAALLGGALLAAYGTRRAAWRIGVVIVAVTLFWWSLDLGLARVSALGSARLVAAQLAGEARAGRIPITLNRYPQGILFYEPDLSVWIAGGTPERWRQREIANPFARELWEARIQRQRLPPGSLPAWEGRGDLLTDDEFWRLWRSEVPLAVVCRFKEIAILEAHVLAGPFGGAGRTDLFVVTNVPPPPQGP